jgi:hypothetical protein
LMGHRMPSMIAGKFIVVVSPFRGYSL